MPDGIDVRRHDSIVISLPFARRGQIIEGVSRSA